MSQLKAPSGLASPKSSGLASPKKTSLKKPGTSTDDSEPSPPVERQTSSASPKRRPSVKNDDNESLSSASGIAGPSSGLASPKRRPSVKNDGESTPKSAGLKPPGESTTKKDAPPASKLGFGLVEPTSGSFSMPPPVAKPRKARNELAESITVVVRIRPLLADNNNKAAGMRPCIILTGDVITIDGEVPGTKGTFSYDRVYGPDCTQQQLHEDSTQFLVSQVIDGFNGTAFVYGQTGSGKTHTMMGDVTNPAHCGVVPRSIKQVFDYAKEADLDSFNIKMSLLEIYNENVHDLLNPSDDPLEVREEKDKTFSVDKLTVKEITSFEQGIKLVVAGNENRAVSSNNMHRESSRSHCMLTLYVTKKIQIGGQVQTTEAKLNLVDLAGSERYQEAGGQLAKESVNINQSLSCLANVISALTSKGKVHIPYRDSQLTKLLKDSLGGNCKTLMIANCHQAFSCVRETLSTLRYAQRAKKIKNKARINADEIDDRVQVLLDENAALKDLLVRKDNFTRLILALFHETVQKDKITGNEEGWEGASIDQLYRAGVAARIQEAVVEGFRTDLSVLMEIQLNLLMSQKEALVLAEQNELAEEQAKMAEEQAKYAEEYAKLAEEQVKLAEEHIQKNMQLLAATKEQQLRVGYLAKKSTGFVKRWQKRYVTLSSKAFVYHHDENDLKDGFRILLDGLIVSEGACDGPRGSKTLSLQTDDRSYFFLPCEDDQLPDPVGDWVNAIRTAIIQFHVMEVDIKKLVTAGAENPSGALTPNPDPDDREPDDL